ncbi:MAG: outer membrane beta-barrel protein [Candidatus Zixiibacteriota bacterium]|nr:MAG: outer membrane beta-barrel protein [candidate division Zixibacteria bacterium]
MKRLAVVLAVFLVFAVTAGAQGDAARMKPVIYAGGGIGLPLSPSAFSDGWKMGIGFGGGVGLQVTPYVEVIGKFFFNTFPLDLPEVPGITTDGGDLRFMEFGADVKYIFTVGPDSPVGPFLLAGAGMANVKVTDFTVSGDGETNTIPFGDYSETKFALAFGGGFDYMFSPKAGMWVEGRYALVLTEGDSFGYFPIRVGVKLLLGE